MAGLPPVAGWIAYQTYQARDGLASFGDAIAKVSDRVTVVLPRRPTREHLGPEQILEPNGGLKLRIEVFEPRRHQHEPGRPHQERVNRHRFNLPENSEATAR